MHDLEHLRTTFIASRRGEPHRRRLNTPDDPKCLDEATALFVSITGDDAAADGTRSKPFATLAAALSQVTPTKRRIYVCDGTYPEDVRLTASHAGVSLLGGFTCDWSVSTDKPRFGVSPLALEVDGAAGVAIANIVFQAADATEPGASSIAAFVNASEVTFKGVSLLAGNGMNGADGVLVPFNLPSQQDLNGNDGSPPLTAPRSA